MDAAASEDKEFVTLTIGKSFYLFSKTIIKPKTKITIPAISTNLIFSLNKSLDEQ